MTLEKKLFFCGNPNRYKPWSNESKNTMFFGDFQYHWYVIEHNYEIGHGGENRLFWPRSIQAIVLLIILVGLERKRIPFFRSYSYVRHVLVRMQRQFVLDISNLCQKKVGLFHFFSFCFKTSSIFVLFVVIPTLLSLLFHSSKQHN